MVNGSKISRWLHFAAVSSLVAIINALTEVFKEKASISCVTFSMVLCSVFSDAFEGFSSLTPKESDWWNNRQNLFKKLLTPEIPAVFQGLACSMGPKNISYMRKVSAPYWSQIASGLTTLYLDFDIFSTSRPTMYLPSSNSNVASAKWGCHFFTSSIFNSFWAETKETSTCTGTTFCPLQSPLERYVWVSARR